VTGGYHCGRRHLRRLAFGMSSVLLANDPDRLSVILPAIDRRRFRETVADFGDPALDI